MPWVFLRFTVMTVPVAALAYIAITGQGPALMQSLKPASEPAASQSSGGGPPKVLVFVGVMFFISAFALSLFFYVLRWLEDLLTVLAAVGDVGLKVPGVKFGLLAFKSLQRNRTRTMLAYLATFVLVLVVTMVWSILAFIDKVQSDKAEDFKVIITEKFQIPSQMPRTYPQRVWAICQDLPEKMRPTSNDFMTWQFVGGSLDPKNRTFNNSVFFFALDPPALRTMMDGIERRVSRRTGDVTDELEAISPAEVKQFEDAIEVMRTNIRACIIGRERLALLQKKVGERIKVSSFNYKDIDFELEIVGTFPPGRYDQSAAMNREYLNRSLDDYDNKNKPTKHPLSEKTVNLIWVRLPSKEAFARLSEQVNSPGVFASPSIKMETASSAIGSFLDAYREVLWCMRWLLGPAILATMTLVIANAISISVRERRTEMAVLKVLGFQPTQVMLLVLGEAILVGGLSGFLSAAVAYLGINLQGGIKFPIAFFPAFFIPSAALWWGIVIGAGTAFAGSFLPAWSARSVKVSEVFSKIA